MKKPKLLIIVLFQNLVDEEPYYARNPAPPLPGILLAGMTPPIVEVEVLHEMVRPIDYNNDADFIAISFMDYLSPHAYQVAERFRIMGKTVIGGGKFASTHPDNVQPHFDSILVGEAQSIWPQMVQDMVKGKLKKRYEAGLSPSLDNIPPPRYDLVEKKYFTPIVTEATRGCPHSCTYCQLNIVRTPHRKRPIQDVICDLKNTKGLPWYKKKTVMLLDNNLGGDIKYAKDLLKEIAKLKFWGIGTQFSIECLRDDEFVDALSNANCRMAFLGMESLNEESLRDVQKKQNKVEEYKEYFDKLNRKGILTFSGLMFALDKDTKAYYDSLPEKLDEVGCSVILPSISIPLYGTPLYFKAKSEGRLIDGDLSHFEGDHVLFKHKHLTEDEIYEAYRSVNKIFYSWINIFKRWLRFLYKQSKQESVQQFILKMLITTVIYFKLSIFQRHHAQKRVFSRVKSRRKEMITNAKSKFYENPITV
ncbi:MAG: radical SAM protein [Ignavibacteria bacterium]|nr:radical SAM protein [Ignavibacteria bacterium]MBT8380743.1 radical SAM protein [Ignavibacteria bacterium]MBT8392424.1 radical SAM protein [Ignavibacteria bacterium]NNJ54073.1 radical SAM protein [Ignavibacteriaceae bacterium]NNL22669.1 radical SAM protein [Ignavibacteriaceae bacterium]